MKVKLDFFCKKHAANFNGNTKRAWLTFLKILIRYFKIIKNIPDTSFSLRDFNSFKKFMLAKKLSNNTICAYSDKLKALLRAAARDGYSVCKDLHLMTHVHDEAQSIYLTSAEVDRIYRLKLGEGLSIVRDYFVIGCLTGLRFSDYSRLTKSNIFDDKLIVLHQKTNIKVVIPMHTYIKDIFKKYKNNIPACPTQSYFNRMLPTIGCRARINDRIIIERKIDDQITITAKLKHEMISSHTARRSAATNMYLAGIPAFRIMLITGHSTEHSFFKYIRIGRQENADLLSKNAFFN